jgi:hypothetical protein
MAVLAPRDLPSSLHRRGIRGSLELAPEPSHRVAYTAPMGRVDAMQLRRQRFLATTDVRLARADGTADVERLAVAIINVVNASELREV